VGSHKLSTFVFILGLGVLSHFATHGAVTNERAILKFFEPHQQPLPLRLKKEEKE